VSVKVSQPANLDKPPEVNKIDLDIGNIAVLSDGVGTADYMIEAMFNILPNVFRQLIIDALEEPLREKIEIEVRKIVDIEDIIEKHLP